MTNYYQILGVPSNATTEQIKAAYREYAKHYHPDKHFNSEFFKKRFQDIQSAYEVLSNSALRSEYDEEFNDSVDSSEYDELVSLLNNKIEQLDADREKLQAAMKSSLDANNSLKTRLKLAEIELNELRLTKSNFETDKQKVRKKSNGKEGTRTYFYLLLGGVIVTCLVWGFLRNDFFGVIPKILSQITSSKATASLTEQFGIIEDLEDAKSYQDIISLTDSLLNRATGFKTRDDEFWRSRVPEVADFYTYRGNAYAQLGNDGEAAKAYDLAIQMHSVLQPLDYVGLSKIKLKENDPIAAIMLLNKALEMQPNAVEARTERARQRFMLRNFKGALADLQAVIAVYPRNPVALYRIGDCYIWLGDKENACKFWNEAVGLGYDGNQEDIAKFCR